jgi:hypothetical protein
MNRVFRIGDRVKVIAGPRAGEVTTVTSSLVTAHCKRGEAHAAGECFCDLGSPGVHCLDLRTLASAPVLVSAPPSWLEPFWPGKESADQSLADILSGIRATGVKESA